MESVENRVGPRIIVNNPDEVLQYRLWQKGGEIVAGTILGISISALFGLVFAYTRDSIPGSNNKKKGLMLAGTMFLILFLIPALKYPANPPAVGDPETIVYRQVLYIAMLAITGFSALLCRNMGQKESKYVIIPLVYVAIIVLAFILLPPNPDEITISMDLVMNFRLVSVIKMGMFWGILGLLLGSFWDKFKPHEMTRFTTMQK